MKSILSEMKSIINDYEDEIVKTRKNLLQDINALLKIPTPDPLNTRQAEHLQGFMNSSLNFEMDIDRVLETMSEMVGYLEMVLEDNEIPVSG